MCANWLCAGRIGLGWAYDAISFACHMFMHFSCIRTLFSIYLLYLKCVGTFSYCLSLPLSFLFMLVMSMAHKRKSALSQNPLHFRSSSLSDPTPSSIRFHDEDAQKDFLENFSRRGVHSECRVILADFADTDLPDSFTVGVRSHCMTSRSHVLPCWSKSFTPTCVELILQYNDPGLYRKIRILAKLFA